MNRPEIENFIHTNFAGFTQDYPWEDTPLRSPGILPAYHMNKTHRITIPLDGQCPDAQLKSLIALSYKLTSKKRPKHAIINNI